MIASYLFRQLQAVEELIKIVTRQKISLHNTILCSYTLILFDIHILIVVTYVVLSVIMKYDLLFPLVIFLAQLLVNSMCPLTIIDKCNLNTLFLIKLFLGNEN